MTAREALTRWAKAFSLSVKNPEILIKDRPGATSICVRRMNAAAEAEQVLKEV